MSFARTLTIGRQYLLASAEQIERGLRQAGAACSPVEAAEIKADGAGYAESLFAHLGGERIDSLDASRYEHATLVHDLNHPLPAGLSAQYSVVFDGGSLEHVFNFPQALKSCMHSCRSRPVQGEKRAVIIFVSLGSLKSSEAHRHVGLGHVALEVAGLIAHVDPLPDVCAIHHQRLTACIPEGTCA